MSSHVSPASVIEKEKIKLVKIGGQSYSNAYAGMQLQQNPSGKTMNIFF